MSSDKPNYFIQHYQPANLPTQTSVTPGNPEQGSFADNTNEYAPIVEYVEPIIPAELEQHLQPTTKPFTPPPDIPLKPISTPPMITPATQLSLPLTEPEIEDDLKTNIYSAIRWLAEWCVRQLKIERDKIQNNTKV